MFKFFLVNNFSEFCCIYILNYEMILKLNNIEFHIICAPAVSLVLLLQSLFSADDANHLIRRNFLMVDKKNSSKNHIQQGLTKMNFPFLLSTKPTAQTCQTKQP